MTTAGPTAAADVQAVQRQQSRVSADAVSRAIVLVSCGGAIAFQAALLAPVERGSLAWLVAATTFVAGLLFPSATRAAVLFAAATTPALVVILLRVSATAANRFWIAALFGLVASATRLNRWSIPESWRFPIALWGLTLALAWPLVVAREADFSYAVLRANVPVTGRGMPPLLEGFLIAHFASVQLIGLLWIDALFSAFAGQSTERFERHVVWPLGAGVFVSVMVGLYQMWTNAGFLNPSVYGGTGRASGLILDGNVFGVLSAMWTAGFAWLATRQRGFARWGLIGAALVSLVTVWGSGSRTSLLLACCTVAGLGVVLWTALRSTRGTLRAIPIGLVVVLSVVGLIAFSSRATTGPWAQIQSAIKRSQDSGRGLIPYLWERDGYGTAAVQMIGESPLVGVGTGGFYALVMDYSRLEGADRGVNTDNAQNWFRHQLAELGVLGSVGWIWLVGLLTVGIVTRPIGVDARGAVITAGALIGLGLASMLGMPTQHVAALLVFWTFVFWHQRLRGPQKTPHTSSPVRTWWPVFAIVLIAFVGCTVYLSRTTFRVPQRALRFGWPYTFGFQPNRPVPGETMRRIGEKAVTVFPIQGPYLKMTFWAEHPDVETEPVTLRIWRNSRLIGSPTLSSHAPVTWYLRAPLESAWMMLEMDVDRTWEGAVPGGRQQFGLALANWEFVSEPPPRTAVID